MCEGLEPVHINPLLIIVKLFILPPNDRNREFIHGFEAPRSNATLIIVEF